MTNICDIIVNFALMKKTNLLAILFLYIFVGAVIFSSLVGCRTPQQRHDILLQKYGDLCNVDTVLVIDTVVTTKRIPVPERYDSFIVERDTVIETAFFLFEKKGKRFNVTAKKDTILFRDTIPFKFKIPTTVMKDPNSISFGKFYGFSIFFSIISLCVGFFISRAIYKD